ncbi:MAG: ELWxxDGT repeat protein, partial [Candidatus Aquicultor sp.]
GDGLDDLLIGVKGFKVDPVPDPRNGWAYLLGGRQTPANTGIGSVTNGNALSDDTVIGSAWTAYGSAGMTSRAVFALAGSNNNLWFEAKAVGSGFNDVLIKFVMDSSISDPAKAEFTDAATDILTIKIRNRYATANDVINAVTNNAEAAGFRANFTIGLTAEQVMNLTDHAGFRVYDASFGAGVYALGDLNRDGYDDFAVSRTREDAGSALGSLLVFYGRSSYGAGPAEAADASNTADVRIQQATAAEIGATSLVATLQASAGDIDGSGTLDLIIGQTEVTRISTVSDNYNANEILSRNQQGSVYIFKDFAEIEFSQSKSITLAAANLTMDGEGEYDQFGILSATPQIDLDGDRIDDLLLGAAMMDGQLDGAKKDAGQLYAIYGHYQQYEMPTTGYAILTNRVITGSGNFLVDTGIGRPDQFYDPDLDGDGILDSTRYTLLPGEGQKWYRFTTLGDGQLGTMIRLTPAASAGMTTRLPAYDGVIEGGLIDVNGITANGELFLVPAPATAGDTFSIVFQSGALNVSYEAGTKTLTLTMPVGTTVNQLIAAINLQGSFKAALAGTSNTGAGVIADPDAVALDQTLDLNLILSGEGLEIGQGKVAILEFDLTPYLAYMDDPEVLARVALLLTGLSGESVTLPANVSQLTVVGGNRIFFTALNADGVYEIWGSNGAAAGTFLLSAVGGTPANLVDVDGALYFTVSGGTISDNLGTTKADHLWRVAGNNPDTMTIEFVDEFDEAPTSVAAVGSKLYLLIDGNVRVDGDYLRYGGNILENAGELTMVNVGGTTETLYFVADYVNIPTLFAATASTPALVGTSIALTGARSPYVYVDASGKEIVFFKAPKDGNTVLWYAEGATAVTVYDANSRSLKNPGNFTLFQGLLYFTADNGASGTELWKTEGATFTLIDVNSGGSANVDNLFVYTNGTPATTDDILYFSANGGANTGTTAWNNKGAELWKTAGASVSLAADIFTGTASSNPGEFVEYGSAVYFAATGSTVAGEELWKTVPGTGEHTLVKNIYTADDKSSSPQNLIVHAGKIYFTAADAAHGRELWVSDGTPDGTVLFKDIYSGATDSGIDDFIVYTNGTSATNDDVLYFTANDGLNGMEVWMLGTGAATVTLSPPGDDNDIVLTSSSQEGGVTIKLVHDDSLAAGAADATGWSSVDRTLTVRIDSGVTKAETVIAAINATRVSSGHGLTAAPTGDATSDDGTINTLPVPTASGVDATPVSYPLTMPGADNDIRLIGEIGADYSGLTVKIIDDGPNTYGSVAETTDYKGAWDEYHANAAYASKVLTIYIETGKTTRMDVMRAIGTADIPNDAIPFTAEAAVELNNDAEGKRIHGTVGVATRTDGGSNGVNSSVVINAAGDHNAIRFVARTAGTAADGLRVFYLDDGTESGNSATVSYNSTDKLLTVKIDSDSTTAQTVITAANALVQNSFNTTYQAVAVGPGAVVGAAVGLTSGGTDVAKASLLVAPTGSNNDVIFEAENNGASYNGMGVVFIDDGSILTADAVPYWDNTNKLLIVVIESGTTTAETIIGKVNDTGFADNDMTTFRASYLAKRTGDATTDNGAVVPTATAYVTAGGVASSTKSTVTIDTTGSDNDVVISAKANGDNNGTIVLFIDDGSMTSNDAAPYWDSASEILTVRIKSGVTTAQTVIDRIMTFTSTSMTAFRNTYEAAAAATGIITAPTAKTENGTEGSVNVSDVTEGGLAEIAALATVSGINFTASHVGSLYNGVAVKIVADANMEAGKAFATYSGLTKTLTILINGTSQPTQQTVVEAIANATGLYPYAMVRVATTANLSASYTGSNTLTASANGLITLDGIDLALNDRVLVKNQTTASQNGIYTVTQVGVADSAPYILTRATDFDANAEINSGAFVYVGEGTSQAKEYWALTTTNASGIVLDDNLYWSELTTANAGFNLHEAARVATTANLSATYSSNVLTATADGAISIDGVSLGLNDRVLVKNQTDAKRNGIYMVTQVGDSNDPYMLTRVDDFNQISEIAVGAYVYVREGGTNAAKGWSLTTTGSITLDTTNLTFDAYTSDIV